MKKIINYIKLCGGKVISENERSHYFLLNKKTIRVSDHIGLNSPCNMNIIVTSTGGYLIWNRTTGDIDIVPYEDVKVFIKHAHLIASVNVEADKIDRLLSITPNNGEKNTILGYNKEFFSEKQLKQIESFIKTNSNKQN